MKTRKLGNSEFMITEVGFGAWAIGGSGYDFGWGPQDDKKSIEAIHKALDMGVNWIDTAPVYGLGHSEKIVSKAVKEYSGNKPYIFTKCVMRWDDQGHISKVHDPESIRKECEDSLRRLDVDVIDLWQMHWPPEDDNDKIKGAWEMMAKMKEEGKVKHIGVSNFSAEQMKLAEEIAPITSLQPIYNLIDRGIEESVLPYAKDQNIGVIVYSPMMSGLLTGKYDKQKIDELPEDDWRSGHPEFQEPRLSNNLKLVDKLREIGEKHDTFPGEVAIAWTVKHPAVTAAIVGARSKDQSEGVMNASELELSDEEIKELESIL